MIITTVRIGLVPDSERYTRRGSLSTALAIVGNKTDAMIESHEFLHHRELTRSFDRQWMKRVPFAERDDVIGETMSFTEQHKRQGIQVLQPNRLASRQWAVC